jgi:hypothetical protein
MDPPTWPCCPAALSTSPASTERRIADGKAQAGGVERRAPAEAAKSNAIALRAAGVFACD